MRPKAKWAIGRVFLPYGRVLKTRPQNRFFVVNLYTISFDVNISNSLHWSINFLIIDSINNCTHYFKLLINTKLYYTFSLRLGLDSAFAFFSAFSFFSFFFFFSSRAGFVDFSTLNSAFVHCSWTHKHHFSVTFSLKMGPTVLFTHLKIILLQYFQFSVSAK